MKRKKRPASIYSAQKLAGAFIAFTALVPSAFAADQFFDNAGGPLTWDATTSNWSATTGGPYTSAWTSGNKAIFEGTAGTVNVGTGGNPTVGAIQFTVTGYTLTGGQITLGANATITTPTGGTTVINSVIGETGGARDLSFNGTGSPRGTLTLGGANTYTGATKIDYATVSFNNLQNGGTASSFGSGSSSVTLTSSSSFTNANYTGAGGSTDRAWLTSGTGGAFLNNNGSGAISFNNTGSAVSGTGARTWILGGTYTASSNTFAGLLNNTGTGTNITNLTVNTKWAFTNNNTYTGNTTIGSNGIMQIAGAGSLVGSGGNHTAITFNGVNSTLQYSSSASSTLGGVISGAGKLTKDTSSSSVLTLTNANTYTGATAVNAGTLLINGSITGSQVTVSNAGSILGGDGTITPGASKSLTVGSGAFLSPGTTGITDTLTVSLNNTGDFASFATGAKFAFELNAPGASDVLAFNGLTASSSDVTFNGNVVDFTNLGALAAGSYTLFTFDANDAYTGTLAIGTGLESYMGSSFTYNADSIVLTVIPEPRAALLGGLGLLALLRRRRA